MKARIAHAVLVVAGLALVLWPLTLGSTPHPTCRGVAMRPGDVCAKARDAGVQTYEQRRRTAAQARPVVVGLGVLVAGFGSALLLADLRRRPGQPPAAAGEE